MCGIFLCISRGNNSVNSDCGNDEKFDTVLSRRGPDIKGEINIEYNGWMLNFIGHVLWTQGSSPTMQPLMDSSGNILLWNGDVFEGKFATETECDSSVLLKYLSCDENNVSGCFKQLVGPYAFIYWDNKEKRLWFGRDVIGRHSLLWQVSNICILLSSTGYRHAELLKEVPAKGLFLLDLKDTTEILELKFLPWEHCTSEFMFDLVIPVNNCDTISHVVIGNGEMESEWFKDELLSSDLSVYKKICNKSSNVSDIFKYCLEDNEICSKVASFLSVLSKSVEVRVKKQPGICRTCVKGSTCLHAKTGVLFSGGLDSTVIALLADKYVPQDEPIDLYNVAFQNPSKKDVKFNVPDRKTGEMSFDELKSLRKNRQWNFVKELVFQGDWVSIIKGIDVLDTVEGFTVLTVPPGTVKLFIDITHEELEKWRNEHISNLIHPLNTVLDDSLGCALWFAARGHGTLNNGHSYASSARVVLLGMGADEMLGGYMRHRTQFKREQSWKSLSNSLSYDLAIIGHRNLGRDNRVVADHGCQPRLPYLDENVVAFVQSLPPWKRCYLSDEMPLGVGDKLLLRLVAWRLGLHKAATYPKRAMQFGSRIANSNEKGNNVSHRL